MLPRSSSPCLHQTGVSSSTCRGRTSTRTNIGDELIHRVMVSYHLTTKREAVDYSLRSLVGNPMTTEEILAMAGSIPDVEVPPDDDGGAYDQ